MILDHIVAFGGGTCLALMLIGVLAGSFWLIAAGIVVGTIAAILE